MTYQKEFYKFLVNHFKSCYINRIVCQNNDLVDEIIATLISDQINTMLPMMPNFEKMKNAIFNMNKESAPDPFQMNLLYIFFEHIGTLWFTM